MKVTIYTDGACSGNPGPGGYAAILMYNDAKKEIFGAEENTTNNRMELKASVEGLKLLKNPCDVELYSDSAYLVNAYTKGWVDSWKKNGWKNASKEPVKNIDLWEELETLRQVHNVTFIKVKGHADNEYNNRCDKLAVEAIAKLKNGELEQEEEDKKTLETETRRVFGDLPTFETERLKIRLFKIEDTLDLYEYLSDEENTRYVTFSKYDSIDGAKKRIKFCMKNYTELKEPIHWCIEDKETGKMIGSIDFVKWDIQSKVGEIGYILNKKFWNKGIMTEALKEVIRFGFEKMGLNRIEISCDERNPASARVMEKNGLNYEGTFRQKMFVKGEYINLKVYSILKDEYMV